MLRILLIEDNQANLDLMSYLLGAYGYRASKAMDGKAGLEMVRREPYTLIVCDVHMPLVDGYEVARQLKADPQTCKIPLVAVTALAMVGDRDKILSAGFDGYIAKPIDPEKFVAQIESWLPRELVRQGAAHPAEESVEGPPRETPRHTILAVDNLAVHLDLARSILEPNGYEVFGALGVDEALALARETPCDLILSDVCMADETGFDLLQSVKSDPQLCEIPFIFLTSTMTNEPDRIKGLRMGANRYLFRPIEPGVLLSEIEACLTEAKSRSHGDHPDR